MIAACIIGFIGLLIWGYLAGYALGALADHGPINIPGITPMVRWMARQLDRYMRFVTRAVTALSGALEGAFRWK